MNTKLKTCNSCKIEYPATESFFNLNDKHTKKLLHICRKCSGLKSSKQRISDRIIAINKKGGKCERCGYSEYFGALEFHHIDPKIKEGTLSHLKYSTSSKALEELEKCTLLCCNCHKLTHHELGKSIINNNIREFDERYKNYLNSLDHKVPTNKT